MRIRSFSLVALLAMTSFPALAQLNPETGARPGHEPGVGQSFPLSPNASNIGNGAPSSMIAPTLPEPSVGENATPQQLLLAARAAIAAGRTGEAQEAMERAQTRMLDRATPLFQTDRPSANPAVAKISAALRALGAGDRAGAIRGIDEAMPLAK